jgi:8-oxo-dGTP diphosphatase
MPHLHTGPNHHDATASGFVVQTSGPEPRVLLHKHKLLGVWLQFGGHVEWHENPWQALAHELEEESGYELAQLKVLQPPGMLTSLTGVTLHPYPVMVLTHGFPGLDHFHTDIGFALITDQEPAHKPADGESVEFKAFTRAELAALSSDEIYEDIKEIFLFVLDTCCKAWRQVECPKA